MNFVPSELLVEKPKSEKKKKMEKKGLFVWLWQCIDMIVGNRDWELKKKNENWIYMAKMQNPSFNFYKFSFQTNKFGFCHFSPLSFIHFQLNPLLMCC